MLINTSPEPFSNWGASLLEDGLVIGGVTLAVLQPTVFLILFVLFLILVIWLMPKIWRGIKLLWTRLSRLLGRQEVASGISVSLKSSADGTGTASAWPYGRSGQDNRRIS